MGVRIVITGGGLISSLGAGLDGFSAGLYEGRRGTAPSTILEGAPPTTEVHNFSPDKWLGSKGLRVLDRAARLLCVASHIGLQGVQNTQNDPEAGLVVGTMFGGLHSIASFDWTGVTSGPQAVNPMQFPNTVINSPAGQAAIKYGLRGINSTICAGIAGGLHAISYAAQALRAGKARVLLAGGADELCEENYDGFLKNGILSASGIPRPFEAGRDGTLLGEGAALLTMEAADAAQARGAAALAEVLGFGSAHDAWSVSGYRTDGDGAASAMSEALEASGLQPAQIGMIVTSASGSPLGDAMEYRALQRVFGSSLPSIPACAPKAALGETMGPGGAFNAAAAVVALGRGEVPPTAGFAATDYDLRLSPFPQPLASGFVLVNAFGCDGNNASLVLGRSAA